MTLADMLALALASTAIVDVWFNGSIFAGLRARNEALAVRRPMLAELLDCPYCMTYQVAVWLGLACVLPALVWPSQHDIWLLPIYVLGAIRLGTLFFEPRDDSEEEEDPTH